MMNVGGMGGGGMGMGMGAGAYGAGKAGGAFDPLTFIRRPAVILRIVAVLFAIIVFGCIAAEGYFEDKCIINESGACSWATFVGVMAFLGGVGLLVLEARFEQISSIKIRRRAVMADLGFTAVWALLWLVTFGYLVDQWAKTEASELPPDGYGTSNAQAAAAFSFFSIFVWGALAYFGYLRYRQGAANAFAPGPGGLDGGDMPRGGGGYASYPGAPDDHYQEAPFSTGGKGTEGFQSPAY